jgi:NADPH:quinone reductase-like Zn-dependent oxidoreductase
MLGLHKGEGPMSLRVKILGIGSAALAAVVVSLMVALSRNSPCEPPASPPEGVTLMKATTYSCYGSHEVLRLEDIAKPTPADDELLVRVRAAAINPLEWHYMQGTPYIMRLSSGLGKPTNTRLGVDFAGTVEAVGRNVERFQPGDEVFGGGNGALAEYLTVRENGAVAPKPGNVTFEEAAAVGVAATTALQALRDRGNLHPGQRVLINGASGGVGTFAVQIAKALGAHVTGVSSTRNLELVRSLGADHVIDYTAENFTEGSQRWDLIIDNVGNHPLRAYRRVLGPEGTVVLVGGPKDDLWLGPLTRVARAAIYSRLVSQSFPALLAELNQEDLILLGSLMESGQVRSVIDGRFPLSAVPAAIEYVEQGRSRGKNVVSVGADP